MGVVPEWSAWPVKITLNRLGAAMDGDQADSFADRFEDRPLFDVEFEIGLDALRVTGEAAEIFLRDAKTCEHIGELCSLAVNGVGQVFRMDFAGNQATAQGRKAETARLLANETDDFQRRASNNLVLADGAHRLQRADDAHRAIVFAAMNHRVQM